MRKLTLLFLLSFLTFQISAQEAALEGYVFESGNRGYLNAVSIRAKDAISKRLLKETTTDMDGKFSLSLPPGKYLIESEKDLFHIEETAITLKPKKEFIKIQLHRKPGYIFDVTMAQKRMKEEEQVDAIANARIEVYNNTTQEAVMELENHPNPTFKVTFERGNHYTIMIRKEGFFTKRLEAYVDVKGCILCFDGVGNVRPGVSDVLTESNQMGTLLANIELQPIRINEAFELKNIYYDLNSSKLRPEAEKELESLITLLKDNPGISIEIGSHTDVRGKDAYNLKLSQKRAQSVVNYLSDNGNIDKSNLFAKGYGETQLVNNCKNGVKCSERKHQENRRTELKVLAIEQEQAFANQRLSEIILLENLSNEIIEVGLDGEIKTSGGSKVTSNEPKEIPVSTAPSTKEEVPVFTTSNNQIKIQAGGELPEEIQRDLEQAKAREAQQEQQASQNTATKPSTTVATTVPKPSTTTTTPNQPSSTDDAGETLVKVNGQNTPTAKNNIPPKAIPINQSRPTNRASSKSNSGEVLVSNKTKLGKTDPVPSNYTGYLIEFLLTAQMVDSNHIIFKRHGNILLDKRQSGEYAYLMGDFKQKKDATIFLKEVMQPRYPTAKAVYYMKGKRIGYVKIVKPKNMGLAPR